MGAGEDKEEHGEMCGYCTSSKSCTEASRSLYAPHAEWRHGGHNLTQPLSSLLKNISKRALGKMLLNALDRNPAQGRQGCLSENACMAAKGIPTRNSSSALSS